MIQTFTVPEHNEEMLTENVSLDLESKAAIVHVGTRPEGSLDAPKMEQKIIDVPSVLTAELTPTEITAFKKGLKALVAYAWDKTVAELTEDVI